MYFDSHRSGKQPHQDRDMQILKEHEEYLMIFFNLFMNLRRAHRTGRAAAARLNQ